MSLSSCSCQYKILVIKFWFTCARAQQQCEFILTSKLYAAYPKSTLKNLIRASFLYYVEVL